MRLMAKTGTYAATHFIVAVAVAYALTQDWRIALGIGLIEPLVQTVAYAVHERAWALKPYKFDKVRTGALTFRTESDPAGR